tara:strand:- start:44 stop:547 length:504 start_codon:yes stop_codon:yes gene_type:complete
VPSKKVNVKVINNFLTPSEFKFISDKVVYDQFLGWFLVHGVTNAITKSNKNHYCFSHIFYQDGKTSSYFKSLSPILEKLDIRSLIRCKVNLYYRTKNTVEHESHIDFDFPHKGALLNLSTNDGYTLIHGKKYKSVKNQMIIFDTSIPHSSATCTNKELRTNIVINYI